MTTVLVPFLIAMACCYAVTPLVRRIALAFGYIDAPDGGRKIHDQPIPFGGGISILVSLSVALCVVALSGRSELTGESWSFWGVVGVASVLLVLVGIWDDAVHMRGRHKLALQSLIAVAVMFSGLQVRGFDVLGWEFALGPAGVLFTLVWILGSINAFNLIDGVDGVATIVGTVLSVSLGAIALSNGNVVEGCVAFGLAGALIAFLRFNFAPATIFLGDAGSMLIGFLLGVLAISGSTKEAATIAAAPLLTIWTILILDSVAAFSRRLLTGTSIYVGDRGHIHHRFLIRGLGARKTALAVGGLCAITSAAALVSSWLGHEAIGLMVAVAVVAALAASRQFGDTEVLLLGKRLAHAGLGFVRVNGTVNSSVSLQGQARWDDIWSGLTESAERYEVTELQLNLCIPSIHERYYGSWSGNDAVAPSDDLWSVERPVCCDQRRIGTISAKGRAHGGLSGLISFLEYLEALDGQIREKVEKATETARIPTSVSGIPEKIDESLAFSVQE